MNLSEQMKAGYAHLVNFSFACIYMHCTVYIYVCTVILFRLTTLHMIGNKSFYNNIIQTSDSAGTIVVLTTGFIQCKV